MNGNNSNLAAEFERHRPRLTNIAYGITGDVGEAEDVVQESWLRLNKTAADHAGTPIDDVTGWLVTVTSRLALDIVRSARNRRENYVGPWLPEPMVETADAGIQDPADRVSLTDQVSTALLVVLESLSPAERTAFVLHDVFGLSFGQIAEVVGRSPAGVRQLAVRARAHVRDNAPRFDADGPHQREVVAAFVAASEGGDMAELLRLLDPDVVLRSDGGGLVKAARHPVAGADNVARFLLGVQRKSPPQIYRAQVNGSHGYVTARRGVLDSVVSLAVANGRITAIDIVRNPHKLARTRAWMTG